MILMILHHPPYFDLSSSLEVVWMFSESYSSSFRLLILSFYLSVYSSFIMLSPNISKTIDYHRWLWMRLALLWEDNTRRKPIIVKMEPTIVRHIFYGNYSLKPVWVMNTGSMGEKGTVCFAESTNISRIHIGGHRKRLQVLSSQPRSLDKQKYLISLLAGRGILAGDPNKETCSTKHFLQSGSAKKK